MLITALPLHDCGQCAHSERKGSLCECRKPGRIHLRDHTRHNKAAALPLLNSESIGQVLAITNPSVRKISDADQSTHRNVRKAIQTQFRFDALQFHSVVTSVTKELFANFQTTC
ncbi:hypothetical protein HN011_007986 [Eciton burchellii]|nr:hypothetical protein HN011_007986 [Eciton burchellii]